VLLVPVLYALGVLELWSVYVVAAVYGLLMMTPLAGAPSIIPSLVDADQLETANALETLSFTLSNVIGPPLAGLLIARSGAPNVLVIDAISYLLFALALTGMRIPAVEESPASSITGEDAGGLRQARRPLRAAPILWRAAGSRPDRRDFCHPPTEIIIEL
jgi:MFS family permease